MGVAREARRMAGEVTRATRFTCVVLDMECVRWGEADEGAHHHLQGNRRLFGSCGVEWVTPTAAREEAAWLQQATRAESCCDSVREAAKSGAKAVPPPPRGWVRVAAVVGNAHGSLSTARC